MNHNGISHSTVSWDLEGISLILRWLSYIPATNTSPLPILIDPTDTIDRVIDFCPSKNGYDPRCLLVGYTNSGRIIFILGSASDLPHLPQNRKSGIAASSTMDHLMRSWAVGPRQ